MVTKYYNLGKGTHNSSRQLLSYKNSTLQSWVNPLWFWVFQLLLYVKVITTASSSGLVSDLLWSSVSSKAVYILRSSMSKSLVVNARWRRPMSSSWTSNNIGPRCLFRKYCLQVKQNIVATINNCNYSESSCNISDISVLQTCFYIRSKSPLTKHRIY